MTSLMLPGKQTTQGHHVDPRCRLGAPLRASSLQDTVVTILALNLVPRLGAPARRTVWAAKPQFSPGHTATAQGKFKRPRQLLRVRCRQAGSCYACVQGTDCETAALHSGR